MAKTRIIGVISGKGGVGKTTIVSNLGVLLSAKYGLRTLLIDGNISTSNLGLHLGLIKPPVSVQDLLSGLSTSIRSNHAIYVHRSGVHIIPASLSLDHKDDHSTDYLASRFSRIISDVREKYDVIIIDSAAGLGSETRAAIQSVDEIILVTVPELPTITAAIKVSEVAKLAGKKLSGIVLNKFRNRDFEIPVEQIEANCGAKVIAFIPEDIAIPESTCFREPVVLHAPQSRSSRALETLAEKLLNIKKEKGPSLLDRLRSRWRAFRERLPKLPKRQKG